MYCGLWIVQYCTCRYGLSEGSPDEAGIKADAQAGLEWLQGKRREQLLDGSPLYLYGQSIGGAVAISLAARNPGVFRGMILENTFTSIPQVIPHVIPALRYLTWLCHQRWPSLEELQKLHARAPRTLLLTGAKDELIPPEHSARLREVLEGAGVPVHHVTFPNGTHNDTCVQEGYFEAMANWLKAPPRGGDDDDDDEVGEKFSHK